MRSTVFAIAGLLVVSVAGMAAAAPRETPSKNSFGVTTGGPTTTAYFFGSGFEAGEGFAPGVLEPQNGWSATGINLPWQTISGVNPYTGAQHARLVKNAAAAAGAQHVLLSPVNATPANTPSTVYVRINISNDGGADYSVVGQAPSQGFLSWRVLFSWSGAMGTEPGTIFVLDDIGMGLQFVDTGVLWSENSYVELRVDFNPLAGVIDYYYNGVVIYSSPLVAGTAVEQVAFVTDNFQLAGETCDIDALSVQSVGEPPVAVQAKTWSEIKSLMR